MLHEELDGSLQTLYAGDPNPRPNVASCIYRIVLEAKNKCIQKLISLIHGKNCSEV